jgi:hypothetical protein
VRMGACNVGRRRVRMVGGGEHGLQLLRAAGIELDLSHLRLRSRLSVDLRSHVYI